MLNRLEEVDQSIVVEQKQLEELFSTRIGQVLVDIKKKSDFRVLRPKEWVVAFATPEKNTITIINLEESGRSLQEWRKVLVHELVHLFQHAKFGTRTPAWFSEGLACYIAGQKKAERDVSLKDLLDHFSNANEETYSIGYSAIVRILGEQNGK